MIDSTFRDLHRPGQPLVAPNPWDVGSAVILDRLGFSALATTSSGMALSTGVPDGGLPCCDVIDGCEAIVRAVAVPVSADLERGLGDTPEDVAATITSAAAVGLAGCSIEDHTRRQDDPVYPASLAIERVAAAVEAARGLSGDFVVTARCDHLLWIDADLDEVIARLIEFENVGADVVFAPGLQTVDEIAEVCAAVRGPVSVGLEMGSKPSLDELADAGVARVSVGAVFVRAAYGAMITSARELLHQGTIDTAADVLGYGELEAFFTPWPVAKNESADGGV